MATDKLLPLPGLNALEVWVLVELGVVVKIVVVRLVVDGLEVG